MTSIKDKLDQIQKSLPENMTPNKLVVTDVKSQVVVSEDLTPEDLNYFILSDDEDPIPLNPIP